MEEEHVFLIGAVLTSLAAALVLWPYIDAILWAVFTAYLLHYLADRLDAYIENKKVTLAIITVGLLGFVTSLGYLIVTGIPAMVQIINRFSEAISGSISAVIGLLNLPPSLASPVQNIVQEFTSQGQELVLQSVTEIPSLLLSLTIYFLVAAYLLKDGRQIKDHIIDVVTQLPEYYRDLAMSIILSIDRLFRGVFLSYLGVSLIMGVLAAAGFYIMGIEFWWVWSLIIGIFAFFPIVSAPMVYVPLTLLYIAGDQVWLGVLILFYGIIVLNTIPEIFFRPYLASHQTQEHPLILLLGFIIGPLSLGFKGIILGPIILVVAKDMLMMKYLDK